MDMQQMSTWVKVGNTKDFPQWQKKVININNQDILIYHDDKTWYAFEQKCPQGQEKLDKASIEGIVLTCKEHNVQFNIITGEVISDGGNISLNNLKVFPIKIEDDKILVHPRRCTVDSWDMGLEM